MIRVTKRRPQALVIGALVLALAFVAGCGGPADSSRTAKNIPDLELPVTLKNDKVTPSASRVDVKLGTTVRFTVDSDRFDVLHVHGYDKKVNAVPGKKATLTLTADQTGKFDVEFHEADKLVYQLLVS